MEQPIMAPMYLSKNVNLIWNLLIKAKLHEVGTFTGNSGNVFRFQNGLITYKEGTDFPTLSIGFSLKGKTLYLATNDWQESFLPTTSVIGGKETGVVRVSRKNNLFYYRKFPAYVRQELVLLEAEHEDLTFALENMLSAFQKEVQRVLKEKKDALPEYLTICEMPNTERMNADEQRQQHQRRIHYFKKAFNEN